MTVETTNTMGEGRPGRGPSAAPSPPIDTDALLSRCMGSGSFACTLLSKIESTGKQQADAITAHALRGETAAAGEAAHSLKGAAAIIGAESLSAKAAEIEAAGRDGETALLLNLARDLSREMERCLAYIPTAKIAAERN